MGKVDLKWIQCQMRTRQADVEELEHASTNVEARLDRQPLPAGSSVGRLKQPLNLFTVEVGSLRRAAEQIGRPVQQHWGELFMESGERLIRPGQV